jgi:hypothetical protein
MSYEMIADLTTKDFHGLSWDNRKTANTAKGLSSFALPRKQL